MVLERRILKLVLAWVTASNRSRCTDLIIFYILSKSFFSLKHTKSVDFFHRDHPEFEQKAGGLDDF